MDDVFVGYGNTQMAAWVLFSQATSLYMAPTLARARRGNPRCGSDYFHMVNALCIMPCIQKSGKSESVREEKNARYRGQTEDY
jgi:hypothetical protein